MSEREPKKIIETIPVEVWKAALLVMEKFDAKHRAKSTKPSVEVQVEMIQEMVMDTYSNYGREVDGAELKIVIQEVLGKQKKRIRHLELFPKPVTSVGSDREKELGLLLNRRGFFADELQALFLNEAKRSQVVSTHSKAVAVASIVAMAGIWVSPWFAIGAIPGLLFGIRSYGFKRRSSRFKKYAKHVKDQSWSNIFKMTKRVAGLRESRFEPTLKEQLEVFGREMNPWGIVNMSLPLVSKALERVQRDSNTNYIFEKWLNEGYPIREYEFLCLVNQAPTVASEIGSMFIKSIASLFRK